MRTKSAYFFMEKQKRKKKRAKRTKNGYYVNSPLKWPWIICLFFLFIISADANNFCNSGLFFTGIWDMYSIWSKRDIMWKHSQHWTKYWNHTLYRWLPLWLHYVWRNHHNTGKFNETISLWCNIYAVIFVSRVQNMHNFLSIRNCNYILRGIQRINLFLE